MRRLRPTGPLLVALAVAILMPLGCNSPTKTGTNLPACQAYRSQDELIQGLARAYHAQDFEAYVQLFPAEADSAPFGFFLDPSSRQPGEPTNWDLTEELRVQRRMFRPQDPLPGETQVPTDLWLVSIDITLTRISPGWTERTDLYRSVANPTGLDPAHWKATDAQYHCEVFFKTQGSTDYRVDGKANFIVIEDLRKQVGDCRKFLLYRWEDLGQFSGIQIAVQKSWSSVKSLYRN